MSHLKAATWVLFVVPAILIEVGNPARAEAKKAEVQDLPYVTINHPQFILPSQATFIHPNDLLIGVTDGRSAKAYPAAILAQHGVVQDRMADGPIAVTW